MQGTLIAFRNTENPEENKNWKHAKPTETRRKEGNMRVKYSGLLGFSVLFSDGH
jgi:hypothetical protein